jgi:feruloyl esterase
MNIRSFSRHTGISIGFVLAAGLLASVTAPLAAGQEAKPVVTCDSLAKLSLQDTAITAVKEYAAGELKAPAHNGPPTTNPQPGQAGSGGPGGPGGSSGPGGPSGPGGGNPISQVANVYGFTGTIPAFCRVSATLTPTADSSIGIDVWMPVSGWNGKFVGDGANASFGINMTSLMRGYAFATSRGGGPGKEMMGHPEKIVDYGYRAVHLMTVRAKEIIKAYYGTAPKHSYFFGNSQGGYQAITEARRFPNDYDGIAAGWPPNPFALFNAAQMYPNYLIAHNPEMLIPHAKYPMLHQAVLDACDALDGVKDGIITEPDHCNFQPKSLLCKGADAPDCLTAAQVKFLDMVHQGPTNPRTGQVYVMGPAWGEEMQELWNFSNGGNPPNIAYSAYRYFVQQDPNWDFKNFNYDGDIEKALAATKDITSDANFKDFGPSGAKLLIYVGWENYHNPVELINFYKDAAQSMGAANAAKSLRIVTMPGVFQANPSLFDALPVIEDWVEKGKAPDQIFGSYTDDSGKIVRTRPLCAYPKVPTYKGTGDTDKAENFYCGDSKFAKK